jgi:hypothetical protein
MTICQTVLSRPVALSSTGFVPFIDKIRIIQCFPSDEFGRLRKIVGGYVENTDMDKEGKLISCLKTAKFLVYEGSDSSKIRVRSLGNEVSISGNVGRFNRLENVFNYSFQDTLKILDKLSAGFSFPCYSSGIRLSIPPHRVGGNSFIGFKDLSRFEPRLKKGVVSSLKRQRDCGRIERLEFLSPKVDADCKCKFLKPSDAFLSGNAELANSDNAHFAVWNSVRWSGARLQELHLTMNFAAGDSVRANRFMTLLAMQRSSRLSHKAYEAEFIDGRPVLDSTGKPIFDSVVEGSKVDGGASKFYRATWYNKGSELLAHAAKKVGGQDSAYLSKLIEYCNDIGLLRFEVQYKARYLTQLNFNYLGELVNNDRIVELFKDFNAKLANCFKQEYREDEIGKAFADRRISPSTYAAYKAYCEGMHVRSRFSKTRFYAHRRALLPYGVDISIDNSNVRSLEQKAVQICLRPLSAVDMPDFYHLPSVGD